MRDKSADQQRREASADNRKKRSLVKDKYGLKYEFNNHSDY